MVRCLLDRKKVNKSFYCNSVLRKKTKKQPGWEKQINALSKCGTFHSILLLDPSRNNRFNVKSTGSIGLNLDTV